MTMEIVAILQSSQHSSLCKISSEIDYPLIILTEMVAEILTVAANC